MQQGVQTDATCNIPQCCELLGNRVTSVSWWGVCVCVGGGGVLGLMFAGYVQLAYKSPYSIIVYFLANCRPHLGHFLENVTFAIPT